MRLYSIIMKLWIHIFVLFMLFGLISCHEESELKDLYFQENVDKSAGRFAEIMYQGGASSLKTSDRERFKLVHISDPHISGWAADNHYSNPKNLIEAVNFSNIINLKINAVAATGDFIGNNASTTKSEAFSFLESFTYNFYTPENNIPSFICTGNHDTNVISDNESDYLTKSDLSGTLFDKINYAVQRPLNELYYYTDMPNPQGGYIRFIALDNSEQDDFSYKGINYSSISQKQVDWLINTALKEDMTNNHHIIILNHHPFQVYSKDNSTYMTSGVYLFSEQLVPSIIDAYMQRSTIKQKYKSSIIKDSIVIDADFATYTGEFICHLGGHAHTIATIDVRPKSDDAKKQIMLLANTLSPNMQNNSFVNIKREKGKETSNSFSIYAIDTTEKNIYITYFGAYPSIFNAINVVNYN